MLPEHFNSIATTTIGLVFGLIAVIYRTITRRVDACEKKIDADVPVIATIAADVKHILEHCELCRYHNIKTRKGEI